MTKTLTKKKFQVIEKAYLAQKTLVENEFELVKVMSCRKPMIMGRARSQLSPNRGVSLVCYIHCTEQEVPV